MLHLKVLNWRRDKRLVTIMQPVLEPGRNTIPEALAPGMQQLRQDLHPSDRDVADSNEQPMLFKRDHEDKPPLGWVLLWRGQYSSRYGGAAPEHLKDWGYVFWDCRRLSESGGKEAVLRAAPLRRRA
jgi:hypothetical protein